MKSDPLTLTGLGIIILILSSAVFNSGYFLGIGILFGLSWLPMFILIKIFVKIKKAMSELKINNLKSKSAKNAL